MTLRDKCIRMNELFKKLGCSKQIYVGEEPFDKTGDTLDIAYDKIIQNLEELCDDR